MEDIVRLALCLQVIIISLFMHLRLFTFFFFSAPLAFDAANLDAYIF
jgi:hypothetical protein